MRKMDVQKAVESILDGLYIDGSHHKQEYLAEALLALTGFDSVREYIEFSEGKDYIEEYGFPEDLRE